MKIKTCVAFAIALWGLFANQALASSWTITTSGIIARGYDNGNLFGAGIDLGGQQYKQVITASTDPSKWTVSTNNSANTVKYLAGEGPGFIDTVTVNGVTLTYAVDVTATGDQVVSNELSSGLGNVNNSNDIIFTRQSGFLWQDITLEVTSYAFGSKAFVTSLSYDQQIDIPIDPSKFNTVSSFFLSGSQGAFFIGQSDTLVVTNDGQVVPEPTTIALFSLGLLGFAASRRKSVK